MKRVDFFFDLSSPYSYLAATQLPRLCERAHAELVYRPMVLFAVFKATGNVMPASVNAKARYMGQDLERWAKHYAIRYQWSSHFPANTIKAMRLILVDEGKAAATASAAFSAMWAEDRDIGDDKELRAVAVAGGHDPDRALAAIEEPAVKDRLRANTDEAIARGVFGAPAMVVGEQLFWGNDRLHFVEEALKDEPGG